MAAEAGQTLLLKLQQEEAKSASLQAELASRHRDALDSTQTPVKQSPSQQTSLLPGVVSSSQKEHQEQQQYIDHLENVNVNLQSQLSQFQSPSTAALNRRYQRHVGQLEQEIQDLQRELGERTQDCEKWRLQVKRLARDKITLLKGQRASAADGTLSDEYSGEPTSVLLGGDVDKVDHATETSPFERTPSMDSDLLMENGHPDPILYELQKLIHTVTTPQELAMKLESEKRIPLRLTCSDSLDPSSSLSPSQRLIMSAVSSPSSPCKSPIYRTTLIRRPAPSLADALLHAEMSKLDSPTMSRRSSFVQKSSETQTDTEEMSGSAAAANTVLVFSPPSVVLPQRPAENKVTMTDPTSIVHQYASTDRILLHSQSVDTQDLPRSFQSKSRTTSVQTTADTQNLTQSSNTSVIRRKSQTTAVQTTPDPLELSPVFLHYEEADPLYHSTAIQLYQPSPGALVFEMVASLCLAILLTPWLLVRRTVSRWTPLGESLSRRKVD